MLTILPRQYNDISDHRMRNLWNLYYPHFCLLITLSFEAIIALLCQLVSVATKVILPILVVHPD